MKLRINGNSIRLRLGQSEVRRLATEGTVEEFTAFGPGKEQRFGYALHASGDESGVTASFANRRLVVRASVDAVREWATTDQVSIHALQETDEGDLAILIEKDFECVDRSSGESQDDAYPQPHLGAACAPT